MEHSNEIDLSLLTHFLFNRIRQARRVRNRPHSRQRYEKVKADEKMSDREKRAMNTQMLSEVLSPFLRELHDEFTKLSSVQINLLTTKFRAASYEANLAVLGFAKRKMGFDSVFPYELEFRDWNIGYRLDSVRHSAYNGKVMLRLAKAIYAVHLFGAENLTHKRTQAANAAPKLLSECSYSETDLEALLTIAFLSTLQAAARLTSDPVKGLSDIELLREVMKAKGRLPSPMLLYSILLPPRLLGQNPSSYVSDPIVIGSNGAELSPKLRSFLKTRRDDFLKKGLTHIYETGNGCPVAHRDSAGQPPALQQYFDTIMHAFEALP